MSPTLPPPSDSRSDPRIRVALRAVGLAPRAAKALEPLAGDVGNRRYFRDASPPGGSRILALYPETLGKECRRFLATTELLQRAGLRVPRVLAEDCGAGWTWLEDLGPRTLYERYRGTEKPWRGLEPWVRPALEALDTIRTLAPDPVTALGNPPLDAELLRRELTWTEENFLEPRGLGRWGEVFDELVDRIDAVGRVPCHRDFMVRNLVPLDAEEPARVGVLDHQGLRLGPPFYDLASFLNDSLFPPPQVEAELLTSRASSGQERLSYHRVAAQRTLKAVGTYARTGCHEGLIPATLARARAHLARLPEAAHLVD